MPRKDSEPLPPIPPRAASPLFALNQPERYNKRVRGKFSSKCSHSVLEMCEIFKVNDSGDVRSKLDIL